MPEKKIDVYLGTRGYSEVRYREGADGSVVVTGVGPNGHMVGAERGQQFKSAEALNRAVNGLLAMPLEPTWRDW